MNVNDGALVGYRVVAVGRTHARFRCVVELEDQGENCCLTVVIERAPELATRNGWFRC